MRYAVIDENNTVINVIAWDGVAPYNPGGGLTLVSAETAAFGMVYDPETGAFSTVE